MTSVSGKGTSTSPRSSQVKLGIGEAQGGGAGKWGLFPPTFPDFMRAHRCPAASGQQKLSAGTLVRQEASGTSGRQ